jgi:predicted GNAT family N-acyltransferase/RimJ/RimL family protein N-acetyltransferase
VYALRHEVFVVGQGVDPEIERDDLDAGAVHAVAYDGGGRLLGTGRLVGDPPGPAKVGRMAVAAGARGRGVGGAVLRCLEAAALRRGHTEVVLHAQTSAEGFYSRAGYLPVGDTFVEAGISHREMRKRLPVVRPVGDGDSAALIALIGEVWAEYPGCVLDVDAEEPWLRAPAAAYAAKGGALWVVELDGAVVACGGWRPGAEPGTVELKSLYVSATARRRGLGEFLTGLVEDAARRRGAARIELWSDTRFGAAHRLYARLGYARTGATRELHDLSNTVEHGFAKPL